MRIEALLPQATIEAFHLGIIRRLAGAHQFGSSACFNTATICSTENRFRFIAKPPSIVQFAEKLSFVWSGIPKADQLLTDTVLRRSPKFYYI
jgi:hypothetical protein